MSLLKTGAVQVGQSSTASNNFHWRNLLGGLLRLSRGNAGAPITDVMRVNADNSVEFPGGVASGVFGTGQTWQNFTSSGRAYGTTYTNTTGKTIQLVVRFYNGSNDMIVTINGQAMTPASSVLSGANASCFLMIPNGATYSVSGGASITAWWEYR